MRKNKLFYLLGMCSLLSLTSCRTIVRKDGLVSLELVGEMSHVQYWNSNDSWDLKGVKLKLTFDDGEIYNISALDKSIEYTFEPASPVGQPLGPISFTVTKAIYTDYKDRKYEVPSRTFYGLCIIENPKSNS